MLLLDEPKDISTCESYLKSSWLRSRPLAEYSEPMGTSVFIAHPNLPHSSSEKEFPHLAASLESLGLQVTQDLSSAKILVAINHSPSHFKETRNHKKARVLLRLEPRATYPIQYLHRISQQYNLVLTPGSLREEAQRIMWPYFYQANPLRPSHSAPTLINLDKEFLLGSNLKAWSARPYLLTLVASNKVSPTRHSNYYLRRRAVKKLSPYGLLTFGEMWDASLIVKFRERIRIAWGSLKSGYFPNPFSLAEGLFTKFPQVEGQVADKHAIIQKSKYSLVIENDNFYASEKLIDALVGGSLPFYIGGNLEEVGIDSQIFRRVNTFEQVLETINAMTQNEIENWRKNILSFVNSADFIKSWSGEMVYQNIASVISDAFRAK